MEDQDKFKERAYQILYQKYRDILVVLRNKSFNLEYRSSHTGKLLKEDRPDFIDKKVELAENLSKDYRELIKSGIVSESDVEVIKTLEHCLGINEFFKK